MERRRTDGKRHTDAGVYQILIVIFNIQCPMFNKKQGFSLVEILIGMGLLALVAVTVNGLLFSALRGSRKAEAIAVVKTEGSYALNAMLGMIKYAQSITACPGDGNSVSLVAQDGQALSFKWETATVPNSMASSSSTATTNLTSSRVTVSRPISCPRVFDCAGGTRTVKICFAVESANATDVTERAGSSGLVFTSQATLRAP